MRRILAVLLVCFLGCGAGSFRGTFRSSNPISSVTGTVFFCGDLTQQLMDFSTVVETQVRNIHGFDRRDP
jgi:hypothetical protein